MRHNQSMAKLYHSFLCPRKHGFGVERDGLIAAHTPACAHVGSSPSLLIAIAVVGLKQNNQDSTFFDSVVIVMWYDKYFCIKVEIM